MTYVSGDELYHEIVSQVDDGHFENAKTLASDALKSAKIENCDFIAPIAEVTLNFELGGRFDGDRAEILLDVRTSKSLDKAIELLPKNNIRIIIQGAETEIRDKFTNQVRFIGRKLFFFDGTLCILTMDQHYRHNIIVIHINT